MKEATSSLASLAGGKPVSRHITAQCSVIVPRRSERVQKAAEIQKLGGAEKVLLTYGLTQDSPTDRKGLTTWLT